jgi:dTDP-4-dehydrorhamnose reductase
MDRIYVTGVRGMLGRAVVPLFRDAYEIFPADLGEPDVCDAELIADEIARCRPRYVLHLAAMTDVDGCEADPEGAFRINERGTRNVALACRRCDAVLVYISTGMTYNGRKESPYVESDTPDPINVYARSKYGGELAVRELLPRSYIFYTCWLFGGGRDDKKFAAKIIDSAKGSRELKAVTDKFGSPTYTLDLAAAIRRFIDTGLYGKYHCANTGVATRYDMAEVILKAARIENCRVVPVSSDAFQLRAPRPRMEALRNYNFELLGLTPMRGWREALAEYVATTFAS